MLLGLQLYWFMMAVGAVGVSLCLLCRRKKFGLNSRQCILFSVFAVIVAFVGAKILHTFENWENIWQHGLSWGGVSLFGAVFLIPVLMPLIGRIFGLRPWQSTDICGPCAAVMLGFVRAGCYFGGCCGGWRIQIGEFSFCWPTQIIESAGAFGILGLLLQLESEGKDQGKLYPLFMIAYGGLRFVVEFFRDTPKPWLYLGHGQWFALIAILFGVFWIRYIEVKKIESK